MRRTCMTFLVLLLTFWIAFPVSAEYARLGDATTFERAGSTLILKTSTGARVQIEILKVDLLRIWIGPTGVLETEGSNAAPIVIEKEFPPVEISVDSTGNAWQIATSRFVLKIDRSPLLFSLYRSDGETLIWKELKPIQFGMKECVQTLSSSADERFFGGGQQNGSFEFKGKVMEIAYSDGWEEGDRPNPAPFYMSNRGYGVLRNTWTDGRYDLWSEDYLTAEHQENRFDAYYMVGESINRVLDLYTQLTGRAGLLPRWAFEYGDADCYNDRDNVDKPGTVPPGWSDGPTGTTTDVIASVAAKYREHDMPGGWILPNDGYGCGYTDLPKVVSELKKYGFHTGLWTENGVEKIAWEVGTAGTRAQKLDVAWTGKGYQFAMDANHEASRGIITNSDSRPFVWTVMGWAGIQRYAVTWTGDQSGSWDYIRWHIPTLIGSGLSGMVYSTGDVDGIYGGSPETFTRDLQWKCFTPVLMGMSGWSKNERKHPWWFDEPYRSINRDYLKLKMRLMPYMYTLAREAETSGTPVVRGVMWNYPADPNAYRNVVKYQFLLGTDLLMAPVYRSQAASGGWRDSVYLPQGAWIDHWQGTVVKVGADGRFLDYPVTLDRLPIFVRAGAIIPMYPAALYDGQVPRDTLTLDIYPDGTSEFALYEDDGTTRAYQSGEFSVQNFGVYDSASTNGTIAVVIGAVEGKFAGMLEKREYILQVHAPSKPTRITVSGVTLAEVSKDEFSRRDAGWYFADTDRNGAAFVKTGFLSAVEAHTVMLRSRTSAVDLPSAGYSSRPTGDGSISRDKLLVVNRPAEEPGFTLENAFDGDSKTWFRTVRDQSVSYGPHEFVLSLGDRRVIDGFQIAPRNDKWWKYGNVFEYELYLGESNGQWGEPVIRDTPRLSDSLQTVRFKPTAGRVLRFRVLSTHDMREDSVNQEKREVALDPLAAVAVKPVTISEFRVMEHQLPNAPKQKSYLSDHEWHMASCAEGEVTRVPDGKQGGQAILLNDLSFKRGMIAGGDSQVDYLLSGDWQTLRVEAGIVSPANASDTVHFQVYGDERMLFDSGPVVGGEVAKISVDIRGIKRLSLRTVSNRSGLKVCWVNPEVTGFQGDKIGK